MIDFFKILLTLMLVHIICEFYIQPKSWESAKRAKGLAAPELYLNSMLHGIAILLPAWLLAFNLKTTVYLAVIVTVTHFIVDLWKVTAEKASRLSHFVIQQFTYALLLMVFAFYMSKGVTIESVLKHEKFFEALMVIFAYLLILKPTSIVIGNVLRTYSISSSTDKASTHGLEAGGELIGYLERVLILTFTLVGSYAAIGFVLAAKSIFRFGELSKSGDRSMTEYVLIGSLLSMVITIVIGTLISLILGIKIK